MYTVVVSSPSTQFCPRSQAFPGNNSYIVLIMQMLNVYLNKIVLEWHWVLVLVRVL